MNEMGIKVCIQGRYRLCALRRVHRRKSTGEPGWVDVEIVPTDQPWGLNKDWTYLPIELVRHADLQYVRTVMAQRYATTDQARLQAARADLLSCLVQRINEVAR